MFNFQSKDFYILQLIITPLVIVIYLYLAVILQYLGFGAPVTESAGRRAASLAALANQSAATSAEEDNAERDAFLREVQARDLIEFGMIPVSLFSQPYQVSEC